MMLKTLMWCLFMLTHSEPNKTLMDFSNTSSFSSNPSSELIRPPYLKTGDTVAIVAPSGVLKQDAEVIQKTKMLLNRWGLEVVLDRNSKQKPIILQAQMPNEQAIFNWPWTTQLSKQFGAHVGAMDCFELLML